MPTVTYVYGLGQTPKTVLPRPTDDVIPNNFVLPGRNAELNSMIRTRDPALHEDTVTHRLWTRILRPEVRNQ